MLAPPMQETSFGLRLLAGIAGLVVPLLLRLLYSSCRIVCLDREADQAIWTRPLIGALFHKHFLFYAWHFQRRRVAIMVSRSKDGEIVSRVLQRLGFLTVRGSSSRGGSEALQELIELGRHGYWTSLITDGPRGPARIPKIGAILAARETGHPIAPFAVVAEKALEVKSWDRSAIPYPWSRLAMKRGPLISVPRDASKETCEQIRLQLQSTLISLEAELQAFLERTR